MYNDTWGYGKVRILSALGIATGIDDLVSGQIAPRLRLGQNYPNPFNPVTWIPFYLPADGRASLKIYDVKGERVNVLRDRWYRSGPHSVRWNGRDSRGRQVVTGLYFCVLRHGGKQQTRKLVLVR